MNKPYGHVKEFINDMIDKEGVSFHDGYGRAWKYERFEFYHKDIGDSDWTPGLFFLHLYSTNIRPEAN